MKCTMMAFAVMATLTTGVMAQDTKPAADAAAPVAAQRQRRVPREMTEEQRDQMQNRMLERIKATDEEQYKELVALKEKDKEAFQKKLDEIRRKRIEEQAKAALEKAQPQEKQEKKDE